MKTELEEAARGIVTAIADACAPAGAEHLQDGQVAEFTRRIAALAQQHADSQTRESLFNYSLFAEDE